MIKPRQYSKRAIVLMAVCTLFAILMGCQGEKSEQSAGDKGVDVSDFTETAWRWSDSVVADMTLREKAAQLVMPAMYASFSDADKKLLSYYIDSLKVGGVLLLKGDIGSAKEISDYCQSQGNLNLFLAIDAEWGLGMRLEEAPVFPRNGKIKEEVSEDLMYDYGVEVARECRLIGINMVLGPVLDVRSGIGSVIGSRSFGTDAKRVARLGVAYSRGLEDGNVISVAKHFPGHGSAEADSHKRLAVLSRSNEELESTDLLPFKEYVASGLSGVMVGHLSVTALDSVVRPAAFSPVIIDGLLREKMGFNGIVITDALNMKGAVGCQASDAILAGADIVSAPEDTEKAIEDIVRRVECGELSELALRDHCRRLLFYKFKFAIGRRSGEPISDFRAEKIAEEL